RKGSFSWSSFESGLYRKWCGSGQSAGAHIAERLVDFLLGIHHEGAILRNRLVERSASDQKRPGVFRAFDHDAVCLSIIGQNGHPLSRYFFVLDGDFTTIDIDKGIVLGRQ